jgi:hypothetical protein
VPDYRITADCEFKKDTIVRGTLCPCDGFKSLEVYAFFKVSEFITCRETLVKPDFFKKVTLE